jgi:hypothetical protein
MVPDKSVPRILQQPSRPADAQQQESSPNAPQSTHPQAPVAQQEMGEGGYQATRDYQKNIKEYLKKADIEADAEAAKPRSDQEARELDEAERAGGSHAKGEPK